MSGFGTLIAALILAAGTGSGARDATAAAPSDESGHEAKEIELRIHPSLPPFRVRLLPDWSLAGTWDRPHHVGRIEISRSDRPRDVQAIEVESVADVSLFVESSRSEDVNFDGYLDIGTLYEFGARWGSSRDLVFDPSSGRFTRTALTQDLEKTSGNGLTFDPASKTVSTGFLLLGEGIVSKTWNLQDGRLVLAEFRERKRDASGNWIEVTRTAQ
jgi:hypothetical protein